MNKIKVALIGTPNVGKSTIYNTLTKSNEHTGNWAGKTVGVSCGKCVFEDTTYSFYDLPGTYSLISKSKEEMVATDFIVFEKFDVAVVVCDATSLAKGIQLVVQTKEICQKVVVCLNLMDEADKKGIKINAKLLEQRLGVKVVKCSARDNVGLVDLLNAIKNCSQSSFWKLDYGILNEKIDELENKINDCSYPKRWIALKILENNQYYIHKFKEFNLLSNKLDINKKIPTDIDVALEVVIKVKKKVKEVLKDVEQYPIKDVHKRERKIDKILTSKIWGIPIMLSLLFVVFYITIVGANYPSALLFDFFSSLELPLMKLLQLFCLPDFLVQLIVNGIYKTLYWVVSVMLPPMLIFFPLFSFLEDLGVLPRIAFNMDKAFSKCQACGKQSLTMCMGIGCNAVGVTGARIIDSKRERIIAILTNSFMPCNGKFPTLIAVITMFFIGISSKWGSILCALILTGFIALGILLTFVVSYILSKTILKGETSSFTLELPSYRVPKIWDTIKFSVKNRAIFVLGRAIKVAIPAGLVIWIIANVCIKGVPLLIYLTNFLNPLGNILGLDGVIILAFILGFPANEIVIPIILMSYLNTSTLIDFQNLEELKTILIVNGWTIKRALCFLLMMMYHFPCSTTLLTIKKETNSKLYTLLSFVIPLFIGIILCLFINLLF